MRKQFCDALMHRGIREDVVFLTGDLGFMALEPLQTVMGDRFINAGVAEQNMVTVAASIAAQGLEVWVYSIAPFLYARAFEQIRNDVCFHGLPVKLVGNGGGYGYGVMGPTHHAIDDYGTLLTLPGMSVAVPTFDEDVADIVEWAGELAGPSYLRMGRGESPQDWVPPCYAPWRRLVTGDGPLIVALGPLAGTYLAPLSELPVSERPELWTAGILPLERFPPPSELTELVAVGRDLWVVEEHVIQGSFGAQLLHDLASNGLSPRRFRNLTATAHNFGRYGSQSYLRKRSGLDPLSLLNALSQR